jgi:glycosyltransferase involved in cell wall biosynthesis
LKIISIGPANPLRGGIAKFNESFALACMAEGHDAEIVSFSFLYPGFLFPGKSQFSNDPPPGGIIINTWLHPLNPFNWIIVARKIIHLNPEIVVFHYWMPFFAPVMGFIARRTRKKTKAKILAVTHNLIPHEKQAFSEILTKYFINSIDGLVCLSSSVLGELRVFNKTIPAIYLPHPVYDIYGNKIPKQEALSYLKLDTEKTYLLFFGLIRKYKGLELLLHAFAKVDMPELMLLVAGEFYENKDSYIELTENLGISEKVIFTDSFIPDHEVKYYFSATEMVVQPYITATQSGVTQIAYHFDCPMLVTNTGGLAEIVLDNKTGFVCGMDSEEIAKKILLFFNEDFGPEMIENIKKEKHKFSWKSFVIQLLKLTESL